jgi:hypothetical protein
VVDEILFYISAAGDLKNERDLLGRIVTEIPVTLGWDIKQTPLDSDNFPDLESVANADVHVILLGSDVRAPTGQELWVAQRSGNHPYLFRKSGVVRTPAGQAFSRELEKRGNWGSFKDSAGLRHQILLLLGDHILKRASHYALGPSEFGRLKAWREELEKEMPEALEETRGGAGESGIIISPERYVPSEGILIEDDKPVEDDP